jgi:hypothetical protein
MAGPIYAFSAFRFTEAWYQLSEEERESLFAKVMANREKMGIKNIVGCNAVWSPPPEYHFFGVSECPDIETFQKWQQLEVELGWYRYWEGWSILGTKWEEPE